MKQHRKMMLAALLAGLPAICGADNVSQANNQVEPLNERSRLEENELSEREPNLVLLDLMEKYRPLTDVKSVEYQTPYLVESEVSGESRSFVIDNDRASIGPREVEELQLLAKMLGDRLRTAPFDQSVNHDAFTNAQAADMLLAAERSGHQLFSIIKDDNRTEIGSLNEIRTINPKTFADSVFLVMEKRDFKDRRNAYGELAVVPYEQFFRKHPGATPEQLPLCRSQGLHQKFHKQPIAGYCTAFMIDDDRLVTAGHCIGGKTERWPDDYELEDIRFIRHFYGDGNFIGPYSRSQSEVWKIASLEDRYYSPAGPDYAIVKLERSVPDSAPLVASSIVPEQNSSVFMLGHPMGLPMKFVDDATITDTSDVNFYFATLDAFMGNSGSPVFTTDGKVIGLLTKGAPDFKQSTEPDPERPGYERRCYFESYCTNDCRGEGVTKISHLLR